MAPQPTHTLIKADAVFDPKRGFVKGASILLKNGLIKRIAKWLRAPADAQVFDYTGYRLCPAFCDYHLHFFKSSLAKLDEHADIMLRSGIGTAVDGGDASLSGLAAKTELRDDITVRTAGFALHKAGRYGSFLGRGVEDVAQAQAAIDELEELGVDFVKIINSGIIDPRSGEITPGGFERDELAQIIKYARRKELPVVCHANGDAAIRDALEADATGIVHGFFASDATLELMAKEGVDFIPTITALSRLSKLDESPEAQATVERLTRNHIETVRRAHALGVHILPGSDAGADFIPYGTSYLRELEFLREAGFSIEDVLRAAIAGRFEKGTRPHVVVLDGLSVKAALRF